MRRASGSITFLVCFAVLATAAAGEARAAVIRVPEDRPTIQACVDAAVAGDVCSVGPGTYFEAPAAFVVDLAAHVVVNKAITIEARDLYQSVLDGRDRSGVFFLIRAAARIRGFVIRNARIGILQRHSTNVAWSAANLVVADSDYGIGIDAATGTRTGSATLDNVVVDGTQIAFYTDNANGMTVRNSIAIRSLVGFQGHDHNFFTVSYSMLWEVATPRRYAVFTSHLPSFGAGVTTADPLFLAAVAGARRFPYFLPCASPAVDAGDPAAELEDAARPPALGTPRNDIGAYGGPGAWVDLSETDRQSLLLQAGCDVDLDGDGFGSLADCDDLNPAVHPGGVEFCDRLDNDCDGDADEIADLGSTTCGMGVCEHAQANCVDGTLRTCDPLLGASAEACDGLDNDCDGDADEIADLGSTTCGLGVCEHAQANCVDGTLRTCDPLLGASVEACDGLDNDCDGDADEIADLGSTECGLGVCAHAQANCVDGAPRTCDPLLGASAEACDGLDNDCDGAADEDGAGQPLALSCYTGPEGTSGVGACHDGLSVCTGGEFGSCDGQVVPTEEVCGDGLDGDCDGVADEGGIRVVALRRTVGDGAHTAAVSEPIAGAHVRAYAASCAQAECGGTGGQSYACIVGSACPPVVEGRTGADGTLDLEAPPDRYVLIGSDELDRLFGTRADVEGCSGAEPICFGQVVTRNGAHSIQCTVRGDSALLIVEPEFVEWDEVQELYPFVLESQGEWSVTTTVEPPEGFAADYPYLSETVNSEAKALQFTITDVGSDWVPTRVWHRLYRAGRMEIVVSRIGVRLDEALAQAKGVSPEGYVLDAAGRPAIPEPGSDPRADRQAEIAGWIEATPDDPSWILKLRVHAPVELALDVVNGKGRPLRTLMSGLLEPGEASVAWDGRDAWGGRLSPGRYYLQLTWGSYRERVGPLVLPPGE